MDSSALSVLQPLALIGAALAVAQALHLRSASAPAASSSSSKRAGSAHAGGGGKKLFKLESHPSSKKVLHDLDEDAQAALRADESVAGPDTAKRLFTVCLTGGPCSGKSSSLASLSKALTAKGFDVYAVPEVPTIVMNAGFPYPGLEGGELLMEFELALARSQLALEEQVLRLAARRDALSRRRPAVVFFDRGLLDMKAYMSAEMWEEMLGGLGLDEDAVMERYDQVIHLQTAAFGAEGFYTTANNATRTEGLEEARTNDTRVGKAWEGHFNWRHVPNRPGQSFGDKVEEATRCVLELVTVLGGVSALR